MYSQKSILNCAKVKFVAAAIFIVVLNLSSNAQQTQIKPAELKKLPDIKLPKGGVSSGMAGELIVNVTVDYKGKVKEILSVNGPGHTCSAYSSPEVDAIRSAARAAAERAVFEPATKDGTAIESAATIKFDIVADQKPLPAKPLGKSDKKTTVGKPDERYTVLMAEDAPPYNATMVNKSGSPEPGADNGTSASPNKPSSSGLLNHKAIALPKPPYPPAAKAVRASGSVTVQVVIGENGKVMYATAVSGHALLRSASRNAACGAMFKPILLDGNPVKVSGVITYNFIP